MNNVLMGRQRLISGSRQQSRYIRINAYALKAAPQLLREHI
jgi:hypothetical protein